MVLTVRWSRSCSLTVSVRSVNLVRSAGGGGGGAGDHAHSAGGDTALPGKPPSKLEQITHNINHTISLVLFNVSQLYPTCGLNLN